MTQCGISEAACRSALAITQMALRAAALTRQALIASESDAIRAFYSDMTKRRTSWDAYFDDARSQYWWELAINGARLKDTRGSLNGVKQGFREPPKSQVIFAHPTTAMEFAQDEPNGSRYAATVVVEFLGANWWSYRQDGSMGRAFGVAAIVTMRDRSVMNDISWGISATLNNRFTVGVTTDGHRQTLSFTTDVAKLWNKVSDAKRQALQLVK